jgi:hypothetical protein
MLVVSDIDGARQQLIARGIEVSELFHCEKAPTAGFQAAGPV